MPSLVIGVNDLLTIDPQLAKEWNYSKNENLKPNEISANSHEKVWWICDKGHEWQSNPKNRRHGNGCPYCAGRLPIVGETDFETVFPEVAKEWDYQKNGTLTPKDVTRGSSKVIWQCKKGHEWQATVANRMCGQKCPYCSNKATLTGYNDLATVHPELMDEWSFDRNEILPSSVRSGSNKKVWWKCRICGNEWQAVICNRTGRNHSGCPFCSGLKVVTGVNDIGTTHVYLLKEWDYKKNELSPTNISHGSTKKAWWICSKCGHEWQSAICDRTAGHGCPKCSRRTLGGIERK